MSLGPVTNLSAASRQQIVRYSEPTPVGKQPANKKVQKYRIKIRIPTETQAKAELNTQSDGTLTLTIKNRVGFEVTRFSESEEGIDKHLMEADASIHKIRDRRWGDVKKTIYKYHAGRDEVTTHENEKELYKEIASGTPHGIFRIRDLERVKEKCQSTPKKDKYIYEEKGWFQKDWRKKGLFQRKFIKISRRQAKKLILEKEASNIKWQKECAVGISVILGGTTVSDMGPYRSKTWEDLTKEGSSNETILPDAYNYLKSYLPSALDVAMVSLGAFSRLQNNMLSGPALLGMLSLLQSVRSQSCLQLAGSYNTLGDYPYGVAVAGDYAYVALRNSGLGIVRVSDMSNPIVVGFYNITGVSHKVVVDGDYAFMMDRDSGLHIFDVSNQTNPIRVGFFAAPSNPSGDVDVA